MRRSTQDGGRSSGSGQRAFTLLELMVVVMLIALLSVVLLSGGGNLGRGAAVQSAEATLTNLVGAARLQAMATGSRVRLLVHHDTAARGRFRRVLALQEETPEGWATREVSPLPAGAYVVPHRSRLTAGLLANPESWRSREDGRLVGSSALSAATVSASIDAAEAERWEVVTFVPAGTVSSSGLLLVAAGRPKPASPVPAGEEPCVLDDPGAARGLQLSVYGLARPVPVEGLVR